MTATHERYQHRNAEVGNVAVYDISVVTPPLARLHVDGKPVEDGTRARIVDAFDFDSPFLYELADGRRTRSGGNGWHHYKTSQEAREWHGAPPAFTVAEVAAREKVWNATRVHEGVTLDAAEAAALWRSILEDGKAIVRAVEKDSPTMPVVSCRDCARPTGMSTGDRCLVCAACAAGDVEELMGIANGTRPGNPAHAKQVLYEDFEINDEDRRNAQGAR